MTKNDFSMQKHTHPLQLLSNQSPWFSSLSLHEKFLQTQQSSCQLSLEKKRTFTSQLKEDTPKSSFVQTISKGYGEKNHLSHW